MSHERHSVPLPDGLPIGLVGIARLASSTSIAEDFSVEDHRLSRGFPVRRHLRVIRGASTEWWCNFVPHVANLLPFAGPHVTRLLEVGQAADGIYLLDDRPILNDCPTTLADAIGPQSVKEKLAREVLRQIALGLSHLHQHVGPHGDLCLRSIRVNKLTLDEDTQVAIADAELGLVGEWSGGIKIPDGYQQNRPPEWKGDKSDRSTKAGDVYSLGLIGAQLLLGTANFRDVRKTATDTNQPLTDVLDMRLKDQGVSASSRRILKCLMATTPTARPPDGQAAIELLATSFWQRWRWSIAAAMLGLTCVLLAMSPNKPVNEEIRNLKQESAKFEQDLADKTADLSRLKPLLEQKRQEAESTNSKLASLTLDLESLRSASKLNEEKLKQIAGLVKQPPPPPDLANRIRVLVGTTPVIDPAEKAKEHAEKAKEHWAALKVDQPTAKLLEDLERIRKERKIPDDQYKLMKGWIGLLNARSADWSTWASRRRTEEAPFVDAWAKSRKAPWDESLRQSADQALDALKVASWTWWIYASKTGDSWDVFRGNLEAAAKAQANPQVEKVLNAWMSAFNLSNSWNLRLGKATGAAGNGRWRQLSIYIEPTWSKDPDKYDWREWATETSHDYGLVMLKPGWKRGQAIQLLLEGERSYLTGARPNFIDETFTGPVALWSLHQAGVIASKDFSLLIDVEDCPGPPRSFIQSFKKRLTDEAAKSAKAAAK